MKTQKILILILISITAIPVLAMREPRSSGYDSRVREVEYNADDAILVRVKSGHASLIQLENGEYITDERAGIVIGDPEAWDLSVRGNNIFLRPLAEQPDTNITLVSNKRTYVFFLKTVTENPTWKLKIVYKNIYKSNQDEHDIMHCSTRGIGSINWDYQKRGVATFGPTEVWDDGIFTCFKFSNSSDLPVVYRVLEDGSEMLVNSHISGDTMVVHETSNQFRVRLGKSVVAVRSKQATQELRNPSGTTNKGVKREVVNVAR